MREVEVLVFTATDGSRHTSREACERRNAELEEVRKNTRYFVVNVTSDGRGGYATRHLFEVIVDRYSADHICWLRDFMTRRFFSREVHDGDDGKLEFAWVVREVSHARWLATNPKSSDDLPGRCTLVNGGYTTGLVVAGEKG